MWVAHLEANGFKVKTADMDDLVPIKVRNGVPPQLGSCHTAVVDGYVVEGHVPADDIKRLLTERPAVTGIAVPGMPQGAPGMEGPNPQRFSSLTFAPDGEVKVFETHNP